ncbi:lysozyme 1B-like [Parasteatoda tepidariorum]|uniref:lysozyme 1B-like n=1 Tax=Parasteatoda tepidariorum TaxID=114398 RepID=UPI00077FCA91|nr:lysozyme 1B-like [Parasteatoda tepidariorum]
MAQTSLIVIALCGFLPIFIKAKVVSPCAVADIFMNKLHQKKANAANFACLAKYASGFNTQAVGETHKDGSDDFGIFMINDKYCRKGTKTSCGVSCTDLVSDNIEHSATCALAIMEKEGFSHWPEWKNCQHIPTLRFIDKCDVSPKG